ncbi:MAG TPA: hypothetical protein VJS67_14040 [Pseudonocardiaceae bacterium]|nr:hypothetical protein [Pseudonocardiaceae bacterium]
MTVSHKFAGEFVKKEGVAASSLLYGSKGFFAERNLESLTQELTSLVPSKPGKTNSVPPSGYSSDGVLNHAFEIALRFTVGGKQEHPQVVKLTREELKQQQRGLIRLVQIL